MHHALKQTLLDKNNLTLFSVKDNGICTSSQFFPTFVGRKFVFASLKFTFQSNWVLKNPPVQLEGVSQRTQQNSEEFCTKFDIKSQSPYA